MKNNKQDLIKAIINQIRTKATRWEGLVALKHIQIKDVESLLYYCNDSFWLIRWAIIEKIGNLKPKNINFLFDKLSDTDMHVQKNAQKAISKCVTTDISPIIHRCCDDNLTIQQFCVKFLSTHSHDHLIAIEKAIFSEKWLIANKLLFIVFHTLKQDSEALLIKAIKIKNTQKHAIFMLAIINSKKAIPYMISLYQKPRLKRHIIQALLEADPEILFPVLIEHLPIKQANTFVKDMIIKIGQPILPFIITAINNQQYTKDLTACLKQMTITVSMCSILEKNIQSNKSLAKMINLNDIIPVKDS